MNRQRTLTSIAFSTSSTIGEPLAPEEQIKSNVLATMFIYSHEILLHLYQTKQVDEVLWENIMVNNMGYLSGDMMLPVLKQRSGRLSRELLEVIESASEDA